MTLGLAAIAFLGASRARAAAAGGPAPAPGGTGQTTLTLERVARFPPPGNRVPTGFRFTHDGRILYYLALDRLEPSKVAVFMYLQPVFAALLATFVTGEPLTLRFVAGGALILAGVLIAERG